MNTEASRENQLTLELLEAIERQDNISQRHLAQHMGVALGLANSYLKRCAKKGWIKMKTAPANRYLYYLTPMGFAEKARLTGEFLSTSLTLFRQSGEVYNELFAQCITAGNKRIVLAGLSDLTEIAYLRSLECDVEIVSVFQPSASREQFFDCEVVSVMPDSETFDVVVVSSLEQTNEFIEQLQTLLPAERIVIPEFLPTIRFRNED